MPCRSDYDDDEVGVESAGIIDDLTQKLCYVCANLYADGLREKYASNETIEWHQEHMRSDTERVGTKMREAFRRRPGMIQDADAVADEFLRDALAVHPVSDYHREWFKQMAREAADTIQQEIELSAEDRPTKQQALAKLTDRELDILGLTRS